MFLKDIILRNAFSLSCIQWLRRRINNSIIRNTLQIVASPFGELKYLFERRHINDNKKYTLGIIAIVKNESRYIEEWIAFHFLQGVEKIILYDNGSTDSIRTLLTPYIKAGVLEIVDFPGKKLQCDAYNNAMKRYGNEFKYIAVIDADEFMFSTNPNKKIIDILDQLFVDNVGGVVVNWLCYGSSGYTKRQEGFVIETYKRRGYENFEANRHYKTIVKPEAVFSFTRPHFPNYRRGWYAVNSDGERVDSATAEGVYDKLRINHYFTKSKAEYIEKMNRGKADRSDKRVMEEFYWHDVNDVEDDILLKFAVEMRSVIKKFNEYNDNE